MNCPSSCYKGVLGKYGADRDYNFYTHSLDGERVTGLHLSSAVFGSYRRDLTISLEPNTWHHIAVTVNPSGQHRYYLDGVQDGGTYSGSSGNANKSYSLWLGRSDNFWNGLMDDVRIYNRALSAEEVRSLASGQVGIIEP